MNFIGTLVTAGLIATPTLAQDLIGFDLDNFGQVVLSQDQSAGDAVFEAAFGDYNNEFMSTYAGTPLAHLGRAVGRLDVATDKGVYPCTAFLVSDDLVLTNHHCVPGVLDQPRIGASAIVGVQFVAGYLNDGVAEGAETFLVNPVPVEANESLDYAVLRVLSGTPGRSYGILDLADAVPQDNDLYWIIGHPLGEAQRVSREKCRANAPALSNGKLLHTCDTLPGNSGSPVIDVTKQTVVALHHAGSARNSVNYAIPMQAILAASTVLAAATPKVDPEVLAYERLAAALKITELDARRDALEALIKDFPETDVASTARDLLDGLAPPKPPAEASPAPVLPASDLNKQMAANEDVQACDRLAGLPDHPDRESGLMLYDGVDWEDLEPDLAIPACETALIAFPSHARLSVHLGHAYEKAGRFKEAFALYRPFAETGDPTAQVMLSVLYFRGNGVQQSDEAAFDWIQKAAEQGFANAQWNIGWLYAEGRGVAKSDEIAVEWYQKAAEQGYPEAQSYLAEMYANGRGVPQSDEIAIEWFSKAAEQGYEYAERQLATLIPSEAPPTSLGEEMAANEDVQACDRLAGFPHHPDRQSGLMLQEGVTFEEITSKAAIPACEAALAAFPDHPRLSLNLGRAFNRAGRFEDTLALYLPLAEQNDPTAQNFLGVMYLYGWDVAQSDETAVAWFRKAAEQGSSIGQANLGWMYKEGRGVAQSDEIAVEWYQKAAAQGQPDGQFYLGEMYLFGRGVPQSDKDAFAWFQKAAEQGNPWAQSELGWMYANGRGVVWQSDEAAIEWYMKAAEQGYAKAQANLGFMYLNGRGVAQSDETAVEWYLKAAKQGFAGAQASLAWMYEKGRGVPQSDKIAIEWYGKAAKQGYEPAEKQLAKLRAKQ